MKFRSNALLISFTATLLVCSQTAFGQDEADAGDTAQSDNPTAVIHTSEGDITLELLEDQAPVTVENFVTYAQDGFYDGTIFHRVISHFMIQGGGLTPELQPKATREPIVNESGNGLSNTRGTVAMARTAEPDSATSQFFINVQDNPNLDHSPLSDGYAVFAKVTGGIEVVDEIRFLETGSQPPYHDVPIEPVIIESVEIISAD